MKKVKVTYGGDGGNEPFRSLAMGVQTESTDLQNKQ